MTEEIPTVNKWLDIRKNVVSSDGDTVSRDDAESREDAAYTRGCIDALENVKYALDILENSGSGFEWRALIDHLVEDVQQ